MLGGGAPRSYAPRTALDIHAGTDGAPLTDYQKAAPRVCAVFGVAHAGCFARRWAHDS